MTTRVPQVQVTDGLAAAFASLDHLVAPLSDEQWRASTPCPGWDVHDVVAHIVGTELSLEGAPMPGELPESWSTDHVHNQIGEGNERWVAALADLPPAELLVRYRAVTERRLAVIRQLSDGDWNADYVTPAGPDSYGRFMRIRLFDVWMHDQDIRDAIGQPGHEGGLVVDQVFEEIKAAIGYVVGKKAGAPGGSSVAFDLTGAVPRQLNVLVAARAQVVDELPGPATVTLRLPALLFTRLCGGRSELARARQDIAVSGDRDLADRLIDNLAYTL